VNFRGRDGLENDEFMMGGFHRGRSGRLYFGGVNGMNAFLPGEIEPDNYAPPVVLTNFKLYNKPVDLGRPLWTLPKLELKYTDSILGFDFAALSFADPRRTRYRYQLEGFRDEWIDSNETSVTYTNLGSGHFVFRVMAIGRHGATADGGASIEIDVAPPPWRTWWAYTIYTLIVVGIVAVYLRYQNQRVTALEQRNRLLTVEREIELSAMVQSGLLPENNQIADEKMKLIGFYRPAEKCSGDWWWHERSRTGHRWILVGDVTGHGLGSAMVTAAAAAAFRARPSMSATPHERLSGVNAEVLSVARGKYQMMLSAIELDEGTGKFTVYCAGGLPALALHGTSKIRQYSMPGTPLGSTQFEAGKAEGQLAPGDRLLLLSDGVPEIELKNGRQFGMRRVRDLLWSTREEPLGNVANTLIDAAVKANDTTTQADDWTFVLVEWKPGNVLMEIGDAIRNERASGPGG
jgi:serine phosphatase RsbU (regulator of sigma subunit)